MQRCCILMPPGDLDEMRDAIAQLERMSLRRTRILPPYFVIRIARTLRITLLAITFTRKSDTP